MEQTNINVKMNYQGYLIARERLRNNWSQEGLCKGICTVSYLSKIESGKATASDQILCLLMERLGLQYDSDLELEAEDLAAKGCDLLFAFRLDALKELLNGLDLSHFRATTASLRLELLNAIGNGEAPLAPALESCMDDQSLALQRLLQNMPDDAVLLCPNAYTHLMVGISAYEAGQYPKAIEAFQSAYDLASREGCIRIMLQCKTFAGNSYCNQQDLVNMERCYRVARRIAEDLNEFEIIEAIDYNTASSWIEVGRYEDAYNYFSKVKQPSIMSLHKLAICCEKTQRYAEGLESLKQAEAIESDENELATAKHLLPLVKYRLEHPNYLEQEEYGVLLLDCFQYCRNELPSGYIIFHLPWMLEWYKATRQYKKACDLLEDFPARCN